MKVGVIDYGVGNLGSVLRALEELQATPMLISRAVDLPRTDALILPGVGSFADCMEILISGDWHQAICEEVHHNKPLLGICLGMQLLADVGEEGASPDRPIAGLGLIPGRVSRLKSLGCNARIPHVGWNAISKKRDHTLLDGIPDGTDFYFVHSYAFVPQRDEDVIAVTEYGVQVTAAVAHSNVWGAQFHPEKSSRAGFQLLKNFIDLPLC